MERTLQASQRWFGRLLRLYPRSYRLAFGAHMAQVFRDCGREALATSGRSGLLKLWLVSLPDLLKTAAQERMQELAKYMGETMAKLFTNPNFKTRLGFVLCLPLVINLLLDLLQVDQSWLSPAAASGASIASLALMMIGLWLLGAPAILSALLGLLSSAPFAAMELINRRGYGEEFPYVLFLGLWLMGTLFTAALLPVITQARGNNTLAYAGVSTLLLRGVIVVFIAIGWFALVSDQMPCFLGVPVCD